MTDTKHHAIGAAGWWGKLDPARLRAGALTGLWQTIILTPKESKDLAMKLEASARLHRELGDAIESAWAAKAAFLTERTKVREQANRLMFKVCVCLALVQVVKITLEAGL